MGVAFVVTDVKFTQQEEADDERHGPFAGQVISTVKEVRLTYHIRKFIAHTNPFDPFFYSPFSISDYLNFIII